jgi:photosystem II stability/assembly factor-like uncharacterized protein
MSWLYAVTFQDDGQRGWAVGTDGTILSTRDGGHTWQTQSSGSKSRLFAVTFSSDGQRGWAVGSEGTILSTRDGGDTWEAQWGGTNSELHAVTFTDDGQRGWAVGDDGRILITRDGGRTWSAPTYARYPAPWFWAAAFLVLGAALFTSSRFGIRRPR